MNAKHANVAGLKGAVIRHKVLCIIMALSLIMLMIPSGLRANAQQADNATNKDKKQEQVQPDKGGEQSEDPVVTPDKDPVLIPEQPVDNPTPAASEQDDSKVKKTINPNSMFDVDFSVDVSLDAASVALGGSFNVNIQNVYCERDFSEVWYGPEETLSYVTSFHDNALDPGSYIRLFIDTDDWDTYGLINCFIHSSENSLFAALPYQIDYGYYIETTIPGYDYPVYNYRWVTITPNKSSNDVIQCTKLQAISNDEVIKADTMHQYLLYQKDIINCVYSFENDTKSNLVTLDLNGGICDDYYGLISGYGWEYNSADNTLVKSFPSTTLYTDVEKEIYNFFGSGSDVAYYGCIFKGSWEDEEIFGSLSGIVPPDEHPQTLIEPLTFKCIYNLDIGIVLSTNPDDIEHPSLPQGRHCSITIYNKDGEVVDYYTGDEDLYTMYNGWIEATTVRDDGTLGGYCIEAEGYNPIYGAFTDPVPGYVVSDNICFLLEEASDTIGATEGVDHFVITAFATDNPEAGIEGLTPIGLPYEMPSPFATTFNRESGMLRADVLTNTLRYVVNDPLASNYYILYSIHPVFDYEHSSYLVSDWQVDGRSLTGEFIPCSELEDEAMVVAITEDGDNASISGGNDISYFQLDFYTDDQETIKPVRTRNIDPYYDFSIGLNCTMGISLDNHLWIKADSPFPWIEESSSYVEIIPHFYTDLHEPYVWSINGEEVEFGEIWDCDWYLNPETGRCDIEFAESETPVPVDYNASITADDDDSVLGYNVSAWIEGEEFHNWNVDNPYYTYFRDADFEEGYTAMLSVNENNQLHYRILDEYDDVLFEEYITAICTENHDVFEWNINGVDMMPGSIPYLCDDGEYEIVCDTIGTAPAVVCPGTEGHDGIYYSKWVNDPEEGVYDEDYVDSFTGNLYEDVAYNIDEDGILYGVYVDEDGEDYCEGIWFEAVPQPGYKLASWTINGVEYEVGEAHYAALVTEQAVPATFVANYEYVGDDEPGGHGKSISPKTGDMAPIGLAILGMIAVAGAAYLGYRKFANNR